MLTSLIPLHGRNHVNVRIGIVVINCTGMTWRTGRSNDFIRHYEYSNSHKIAINSKNLLGLEL